jgi:hypothetical protein
MSRVYSIVTVIDLEFNKDNIKKILLKGERLGFKYYESNFNLINQPEKLKKFSVDQANEYVSTIIKDDPNGLEVQIENMFFSFFFYKKFDEIKLHFFGFDYLPWMKTFKPNGEEDIDINKYLKLMLDLVEEYRLLELKIEKN